MAKAQNYMGGGGIAHIQLMGETIEVGTLKNIAKNRGTIGRDTAHENSIIWSYWGGDTTQNPYRKAGKRFLSVNIYT